MRDNKDNNKVQSRLDNFFYDIPRTHPASYIKETLTEGFSSENLAKLYGDSVDVFLSQQNFEGSSHEGDILDLLDKRFSHEDCGLGDKLQRFIDGEDVSIDDKDYEGHKQLLRSDRFILNAVKEELERTLSSSLTDYYQFCRLIQDKIDKGDFDTDEEFEEYKYLSYQIPMLLDNRFSYEDIGLKGKIQKMLNGSNLTKKDRKYKNHGKFKLLDNYILDMVEKGLSYQQKGIHEAIEEVTVIGYTQSKRMYDFDQIFEYNIIKTVMEKIVQEDDPNKQEFLLDIIKDYEKNNKEYHISDIIPWGKNHIINDVSSTDQSLLSLILYAFYDGVTNFEKISEYCESDKYYKYLVEDITFSEDTIEEFIKNNRELILIAYRLFIKKILECDDFYCNFVTVEGGVIYMDRSFIITMNDIHDLQNILPKKLTKQGVVQLADEVSRATYYIITSNTMTQDEKIRYTEFLKKELIHSNQEEMLLNSHDIYLLLTRDRDNDIPIYDDGEYQQIDSYILQPFDNIRLKKYMIYEPDENDELVLTMDEEAYTEDLARDYVETLLRYNFPYKLQETGSFTEYLEKNPYNEDVVYNFITDVYNTSNGDIVHPIDISLEEPENKEDFDTIRIEYGKFDESKDKQKSLCRRLVDYGSSLKIDDIEITQSESDEIESKINLMIISYNIKRMLNHVNNIQEDKNDTLEGFLLELSKEFPYMRFSVDLT